MNIVRLRLDLLSDFFECTRCRNIFIDEEYDSHKCEPKYTGYKLSNISSYRIFDDLDGNKNISVTDFNGVSHRFTHIPENKELTKIPYQPKGNSSGSTVDETESEIMPKI